MLLQDTFEKYVKLIYDAYTPASRSYALYEVEHSLYDAKIPEFHEIILSYPGQLPKEIKEQIAEKYTARLRAYYLSFSHTDSAAN